MRALGIDIGTSSMKAALFSDGAISVGSGSYVPEPSGCPRFSQDAALLAESFRRLCADLSLRGGLDGLSAMSLSSHGPSLVCVDSSGTPIDRLRTWQDNGAVDEAARIRILMPGWNKDGSSWEAKCLRAWNSFGSSLYRFLTPKDYLVFLLTGEIAFDRSTASTVSFVDQDTWRWRSERIGIPSGLFPRIVDPWEPVGRTGTAFSRACRLPDGVPVLGGGIDAYCESLGAGAVRAGDLCEGSGTSTCISACFDGPGGDFHVVPGKRLRIEVMSSTGASIRWLESVLGGGVPSSALPRWSPLLFLPFLNGERSPYWDERLRGSFIGLSSLTGAADLYQAVLQGVGFGVRQNLEAIGRSVDIDGRPVYAAGGGAENDYWLQLKANITGRPYIRSSFKDTAPLGGLCLCGFHEGLSDPVSELGLVDSRQAFEPDADPAEHDAFDALYAEYARVAEALASSCHRLSRLGAGAELRNREGEYTCEE